MKSGQVTPESADAQFNLGFRYSKGLGVSQDVKKAAQFYQLAADQGHAKAQSILGFWYSQGKGVSQDDEKAVYYYRLAADQGMPIAQNNLACKYARGLGVLQNDIEAIRLFRLAAEKGNKNAQLQLGVKYRYGNGVIQDDKEAARLLGLSAEQGNADAHHLLGWMYHRGYGVARNDKKATRCFRLAIDQGLTAAEPYLGWMYQKGFGFPDTIFHAAIVLKDSAQRPEMLQKLNALAENSPEKFYLLLKENPNDVWHATVRPLLTDQAAMHIIRYAKQKAARGLLNLQRHTPLLDDLSLLVLGYLIVDNSFLDGVKEEADTISNQEKNSIANPINSIFSFFNFNQKIERPIPKKHGRVECHTLR